MKTFRSFACHTLVFSLGVLGASMLQGQDAPQAQMHADRQDDTLPPLPASTPDMWYYAQEMRRYDDPKQAVRRKAELKAAQRRERMAARKWYGFSLLRPQAAHMPWYSGMYSPTWTGNHWDPYRWVKTPQTAVYVTPSDSRRY